MRSNSPRNSRYHHHRRSPSPCDHPKRQRSFSPSPPRASKNELQAIRITVNNVPSRKPKKFTIFKAREEFQGLEQVSLPRSKDQKKIQIEIRRIIPKHRESQSPVRRSIRDHTTVFILRKKGSRLFQQFIYFDHTVGNLHFLSKNSTLISREKLSIFFWVKTRENAAVLDFLAVDNFDFTRKIAKKNWVKNS